MASNRPRVDLDLVLTGHCNLGCGYCYQTAPRCGPISWNTVCAAIDAALLDAPERLNLVLNGGEPLLAPRLVRRTIERVRAVAPASTTTSITLLTNGILLDRAMLTFLLDHEVDIQLSVHPNGRADDTHSLEDRLAQIAAWVPTRYLSHVSLAMVVTPDRVVGLAAIVRMLTDLGFPDIYLAPPFTPQPTWTDEHLDLLLQETSVIVEHCAAVYEPGQRIPVDVLRPHQQPARQTRDDLGICRAVSGSKFCVEPSGNAWACPCFATTLVDLPTCAEAVSSTFDLGNVRDRSFTNRLTRLADPSCWPTAFHHRTRMYSGFGRCGECEFLDECSICPAAICYAGGDPYRIPDHICAFFIVMNEGAQRLDARITRDLDSLLDDLTEAFASIGIRLPHPSHGCA